MDLDWGSVVEETVDDEENDFPYDPEVTDFTLIVEEKKFHVAKVILMNASPVFRKMFTSDFKEKDVKELELPGKDVSSFKLFLKYIYLREYTFTEEQIDEILPLADEYDVKCIFHRCEDWFLTKLEFKTAKVPPHYLSVDNSVEYLMKCVYYGEKYRLRKLYKKAFETILPYRLQRYMKNEHYLSLPEKNKRELLEARLCKIESFNAVVYITAGRELEKNISFCVKECIGCESIITAGVLLWSAKPSLIARFEQRCPMIPSFFLHFEFQACDIRQHLTEEGGKLCGIYKFKVQIAALIASRKSISLQEIKTEVFDVLRNAQNKQVETNHVKGNKRKREAQSEFPEDSY